MAPSVKRGREPDEADMYRVLQAPKRHRVIEAISSVVGYLFPPSLDQRAATLNRTIKGVRASETHWHASQLKTMATPMEVDEPPVPDRVESFLREFIGKFTRSYFEVAFINQIKDSLAPAVNSAIRSNADKIAAFIIKDREFNINDKKTVRLVSQTLAFLLQKLTVEEKRSAIEEALSSTRIDASLTESYIDLFLESKCNVGVLVKHLGVTEAPKFIRALALNLTPKKIVSEEFIGKLEKIALKKLSPILRSLTHDNNAVAPFTEVFVKIFTSLIAKRLAGLYNSTKVEVLIDDVIRKANDHVEAFIDADKSAKKTLAQNPRMDRDAEFIKEFAKSQEGCHPITRELMSVGASESAEPVLMKFFNGFTNELINYIFDPATIGAFVTDLQKEKAFLLENVDENGFAKAVIEAVLDDKNRSIITTFLEEAKPIAEKAFASNLKQIVINNVLLKPKLYQHLIEKIAPAVMDVMQKVMMKWMILKLLKDESGKEATPFLQAIHKLYQDYKEDPSVNFKTSRVSALMIQEYGKVFKKQKPEDIKNQLPGFTGDALKDIFLQLDRKYNPATDEFNKVLFSLFQGEAGDNIPYFGTLLANILFGVTTIDYETLRTSSTLIEKFALLLSEGLSFIRKAEDPNGVVLDLLKPILDPFRDPDQLKDLLEAEDVSWTPEQIEANINAVSDKIAPLLYDLLSYALPSYIVRIGDRVFGLKNQVQHVLTNLLDINGLNINLGLLVLETVRERIDSKV